VAGDVAWEGWGVEGFALEGEPVAAEHPADRAEVGGDGWGGGVVGVFAGP
jgi:hypothetical protein